MQLKLGFMALIVLLSVLSEVRSQGHDLKSDLQSLVDQQIKEGEVPKKIEYWLPVLRVFVFDKNNGKSPRLEPAAYVLFRYELEMVKQAREELPRKAALWRLDKVGQKYLQIPSKDEAALRRKELLRSYLLDLKLPGGTDSSLANDQKVFDQLLKTFTPASKSAAHKEEIETPFHEAFEVATKALPKAWVVLLMAADAMNSVYGNKIDQREKNLSDDEQRRLYAEHLRDEIRKLEKDIDAKKKSAGVQTGKTEGPSLDHLLRKYGDLRIRLELVGPVKITDEKSGPAPAEIDKHLRNNTREEKLVDLIQFLLRESDGQKVDATTPGPKKQLKVEDLKKALDSLDLAKKTSDQEWWNNVNELSKIIDRIEMGKRESVLGDEELVKLREIRSKFEQYFRDHSGLKGGELNLIDPVDFIRNLTVEKLKKQEKK